MKTKRLLLLVSLVAAFAAHAEYPTLLEDWFSQTFDAYGIGASFTEASKVGASGGAWDAIAVDAAYVVDILGRRGIKIDTSLQEDDRIRFVATDASNYKTNQFDFAISADPVPWFPSIDSQDKSRLVLMDVAEGLATFGALKSDGTWVLLYGHDLPLGSVKWYDCRALFECSSAGTFVTYSVKTAGGAYMPLADADDNSRLRLSDGAIGLTAITFRGQGVVGAFQAYGSELDTSRVRLWTADSPASDPKRWSDPDNWYPRKEVTSQGDLSSVGGDAYILHDNDKYLICTYATSKLSITNENVRLTSGYVGIIMKERGAEEDFTSLGTIVVEPAAAFKAYGTYQSIELGAGCALVLSGSAEDQLVLAGDSPICLDGVHLYIASVPGRDVEGVALITGPYGTGGTPADVKTGGSVKDLTKSWKLLGDGWTYEWRGNVDGSSTLWLVNTEYTGEDDTATWKDGAWGNLVVEANWDKAPSASLAAKINYGRAHVNAGDAFAFAKRFDVGAKYLADDLGEVSMSGGLVKGDAVIVGRDDGEGLFDLVGGQVQSTNYLWYSALTVGATNTASAVTKIRGGKWLATGDNAVKVGAGGVGTLQLSAGTLVADGNVGVGDSGTFEVTGGSLVVSNSLHVGEADRLAVYDDASMTISGGAVSNVSQGAGAFYVGSGGGDGSCATLRLTGGEVYTDTRFVAGRNRSADVEVTGGTLVASEIGIGSDLLGNADEANLAIRGGRVVTAGFSSGTNGIRRLTLGGGELVATKANDNFFGDLARVAPEGDGTVLVFDEDVSTGPEVTIMGAGGIHKTGAGTLTLDGYSAWGGVTKVDAGAIDFCGGMLQGDVDVAGTALLTNVKYDYYNDNYVPATAQMTVWKGDGTSSTKSYLRIRPTFSSTKKVGNYVLISDSDGVVKGGIRLIQDGTSWEYEGWTTLGWRRLYRPLKDGSTTTQISFNTYVQIVFDFSKDENGGEGKPYVIYFVGYRASGTYVYFRLLDEDGVTAFPVRGRNSASSWTYLGASAPTTGFGYDLELDTAKAVRWIGEDGAWSDTANWQGGKTPAKGTWAIFDKSVAVTLDGTCIAKGATVNTPMTMVDGTLSIVNGTSSNRNKIDGSGRVKLSGATITGAGVNVQVDVPVEIVAGKTGTIANNISVGGALMGSGTLNLSAKLYGDTSAFAGTVQFSGSVGGIYANAAMDNALASWQVTDGYPFCVKDSTYTFGAFSGSLAPGSSTIKNVAMVVGARDEDCAISGSWVSGGSSGVEWNAPTATLTYSVANTAYLTVNGGGNLVLGSTNGLPTKLSFTGKGGTLAMAQGFDVDPSARFADSTAAIVFDDGGVDRKWASAIAASNAGGFVKRGSGTLTWEKKPEETLDVTIEEGTLVVPYGTCLGYVQIAEGAQLVLDMIDAASKGNALVVGGANRNLDPKTSDCFSVINAEEDDYKIDTNSRNGIVIYCGAGRFTWVGDVEGSWLETSNWSMDNGTAERAPKAQDDVFFPLDSVTVKLTGNVEVRSITGSGSLTFTGTKKTVTIGGALNLGNGKLGLESVSLKANEASIAALEGSKNAKITTDSGMLVINTYDGALSGSFSGALDVTNFTMRGVGIFTYTPTEAFNGNFTIEGGVMYLNCDDAMADQSTMHLTMRAGTILDLSGQTVQVASFTGAGTVENGCLVPEDMTITQSGGDLTIPAVNRMTYVASHAGEKLIINGAAGLATTIVVPRSWFAAGASGRNAIFCECSDIIWDIKRYGVQKPTTTGDGWWSISGSGFTVRLR